MSVLLSPNPSLSPYRADIDGLRALAVLAVLAFHAFPHILPSGFIGVDVFFVISGYLISGILLSQCQSKTFVLWDFYTRRMRRIFPALILVLLACWAFGWFVLLADEYAQLGFHLASSAGFIANLVYWGEAGYFDAAAQTKILWHLWSLGVEEQFYFVWPVFLAMAFAKHWQIGRLLIVIIICSFAMNVLTIANNPSASFFSPQTRFWELACGALLAYLHHYRHHYRQQPARQILHLKWWGLVASSLGLVLLVSGMVILSPTHVFPGWWALLPVAGSVLLIGAGKGNWINQKILAFKPLVWIGLISYPLYLWHWPLLVFAQILEGDIPSEMIRLGLLVLAFLLATLTYYCLEKPIRSQAPNKKLATRLLAAMLMTALLGLVTYWNGGFASRVTQFDKISKASGEWHYPGKLENFFFEGQTYRRQASQNPETTLWIGDSDAEQYYVRLDELIQKSPSTTNSIVFATGHGCVPIPASASAQQSHCQGLLERALRYAGSHPEVSNVVITGLWPQYMPPGTNQWVLNGGVDKLASERLINYIKELRAMGKTVYLILAIPTGLEFDPKYLIERNILNWPQIFAIKAGGLSWEKVQERFGLMQTELNQIANRAGAIAINPMDFLCNPSECPSLDRNGEPIYKETGHLRPNFVRYQVNFVDITGQTKALQ